MFFVSFFQAKKDREGRDRGFTLIELLVVISIVGLLASIVLASLGRATDKAKIARANVEISQIAMAMLTAQGETGKKMSEITTPTSPSCSDCLCRSSYRSPNFVIKNISSGDVCYTDWIRTRDAIKTAAGGVIDLSNMDRDPWGSPYLIDENEGEGENFQANLCRHDTIRSAGPDGIVTEIIGGIQNPVVDDDLGFEIPYTKPHSDGCN